MRVGVLIYIVFLSVVTLGAFFLTFSGAGLPGPDDEERLSLRNESRRGATRRVHFFSTGFYGK